MSENKQFHNLELQRVTDLSWDELQVAAKSLWGHIKHPGVRRVLRERHFLGLLARHGADRTTPNGSAPLTNKILRDTQKKVDAGELDAFIIRRLHPAGRTEAIGQLTIMPELKLRRQPVSWPPRVARPLQLSREVPLDMPAANISAWTSLIHGGKDGEGVSVLSSAYRLGAEAAPQDTTLWTIEPQQAAENPILPTGTALERAGFEAQGRGFYDDQETRRHQLPAFNLYVHLPQGS